jgi:hypothetical protein
MDVQCGKLQRQRGAGFGQRLQQGDRIAAAGEGNADALPLAKPRREKIRDPPGKISGRAVP